MDSRWPASGKMRMRHLAVFRCVPGQCSGWREHSSGLKAFLKAIIASGIKIKFDPCGYAGRCYL